MIPARRVLEGHGFLSRYLSARSPHEKLAAVDEEVARLSEIDPGASPIAPGSRQPLLPCEVCGGRGYFGEGDSGRWCPRCGGDRFVRQATCATCGGLHYTFPEHPLDHPDFGKAVPCPDCDTVVAVEELLISACVPANYTGYTLEGYKQLVPAAGDSLAVNLIEMLPAGPRVFGEKTGRRGIYLYGDAGVGKTGLAVGAMRLVLKNMRQRMVFATWEFYLEKLRPYDEDQLGRRLAKAAEVEAQPDEIMVNGAYLAVLDDVGQVDDRYNAWRAEQLYRVLDSRLGWTGGFTIVTSNLDPDEFERVFGKRARSRLEGLCQVVYVRGPDLRRRGSLVA